MQRQMIADIWRRATWASSAGPGRPFSIGSVGIGAWTMVSQARQLIFGRTCSTRLKCEGTYSSTSRSSAPIRPNFVSAAGRADAGRFVHDRLKRQMVGQGRADARAWLLRRRPLVSAASSASGASIAPARVGVALFDDRRSAVPAARSRGRAFPTSARSGRAAGSRAACAASRSAASWRELRPSARRVARRSPPSGADRRDRRANQAASAT